MKNFKLISLFCLMVGLAKSQPYGEFLYTHGSVMSSGIATNLNSINGFVMAGYKSSVVASADNFFIDQTDENGVFVMTGSFSNGYKIKRGTIGCGGPLTNVNTCNGVSVIETPLGLSGQTYALAGTYQSGLFFSLLKSDGTPISPKRYNFNLTPLPSSISKPLLALAPNVLPINVMNYYICGSYIANATGVQYMYVLVVDENGTVLDQNEYSLPTNLATLGILEPKGIIEEATGSGDLIIVGRAFDPTPAFAMAAQRGFFMRMTPGSALAPPVFKVYGQTASINSPDRFTSITRDGGGTNNLIGGSSDSLVGSGTTDWFVNMTPAGVINWSKIFVQSLSPDDVGGVVGVASCVNGANILNYGVSQSPTKGIVTMKLDVSGNAYAILPLPTDINTYYNNVSGQFSGPLNITVKPGSTFDEGIHIFGQASASSVSDHYLTLAYFNGVEQCSSASNNSFGTTIQGPQTVRTNNNLIIGTPSSYQACTSISLVKTTLTTAPTIICISTGPVMGGSNARPNTATGIAEATSGNYDLQLAPNPTTGRMTINYNTQGNGKVQFTLYNNLGQLVKQIYSGQDNGGEHNLDLDLNNLGIEDGIYFLNAELDGTRTTQKIIYTKN